MPYESCGFLGLIGKVPLDKEQFCSGTSTSSSTPKTDTIGDHIATMAEFMVLADVCEKRPELDPRCDGMMEKMIAAELEYEQTGRRLPVEPYSSSKSKVDEHKENTIRPLMTKFCASFSENECNDSPARHVCKVENGTCAWDVEKFRARDQHP
jgi:hypothetical protein